jgi:hypothetical protein
MRGDFADDLGLHSDSSRYDREHVRQALQQRLRAARLAGHDISALIGRITAAPSSSYYSAA